MKKTYQSPQCQAILLADDDVLTASVYTEASVDNENAGTFGDGSGAVIEW